MADITIYLKPRPISRKYKHSNYLPFKYSFNYGPFFSNHGSIPSDATEVYTVHSPALSTSLSTLYNDILPSLDAEVPDPNKLPRSAWPGIHQLAVAKVDSSFYFQLECENHVVQVVKGDRAPAPPPTSRRRMDLSPEWYDIVYPTLLRGDVELRDESRDTEMELFVWAYMYYVANERVHIWRGLRQEMYQLTRLFFAARLPSSYSDSLGLFNLVSKGVFQATSAIASVFSTEASVDENEPPLLSPSSSNGSSVTDKNKPGPLPSPSSSNGSSTYSHADDLDDVAKSLALYRPLRRRNLIVADSIDL